jgi:hypothetical protein
MRKVLQDFLAPELQEIKGELKVIGARLDGINQRFDDLIERLELNKRLEALERDREERRAS